MHTTNAPDNHNNAPVVTATTHGPVGVAAVADSGTPIKYTDAALTVLPNPVVPVTATTGTPLGNNMIRPPTSPDIPTSIIAQPTPAAEAPVVPIVAPAPAPINQIAPSSPAVGNANLPPNPHVTATATAPNPGVPPPHFPTSEHVLASPPESDSPVDAPATPTHIIVAPPPPQPTVTAVDTPATPTHIIAAPPPPLPPVAPVNVHVTAETAPAVGNLHVTATPNPGMPPADMATTEHVLAFTEPDSPAVDTPSPSLPPVTHAGVHVTASAPAPPVSPEVPPHQATNAAAGMGTPTSILVAPTITPAAAVSPPIVSPTQAPITVAPVTGLASIQTAPPQPTVKLLARDPAPAGAEVCVPIWEVIGGSPIPGSPTTTDNKKILPSPFTTEVTFVTSESGTLRTIITPSIVSTFPSSAQTTGIPFADGLHESKLWSGPAPKIILDWPTAIPSTVKSGAGRSGVYQGVIFPGMEVGLGFVILAGWI
jgi:hypothetical protein